MNFTKFIITALGLTLLTAHSYASETGYEVELIIYEDATKRYIDSEDWSYNDKLNQTNDAVVNPESLEPDAQFSVLDWNGAVLSNALQKIQDSPGLNVLLKKRWRQTGLDRDNAYSVEIEAQRPQAAADTDVNNKLPNELGSDQLNNLAGSVDAITPPTPAIKGYVRLVMSRYLHFEVNFNYARMLQNNKSGEDNYIFPVVAERRMRSREIHYIDHPLVGIIIHATPYTIDTESQKSN